MCDKLVGLVYKIFILALYQWASLTLCVKTLNKHVHIYWSYPRPVSNHSVQSYVKLTSYNLYLMLNCISPWLELLLGWVPENSCMFLDIYHCITECIIILTHCSIFIQLNTIIAMVQCINLTSINNLPTGSDETSMSM